MPEHTLAAPRTVEIPGDKARRCRHADNSPIVPIDPLGIVRFLRRIRDNPIAALDDRFFSRDFVAAKFLFGRFIFINQPEIIEHVLLGNYANYPKGPFTRETLGPTLGNGLLTNEGASWRRQRRIVAPAFQQKRVSAMAAIMTDRARELVDRWTAAARNGTEVDVFEDLMTLSLDIATRALLSVNITGSDNLLATAVTTILDNFGRVSLRDVLGVPTWIPRRRNPQVAAAIQFVRTEIDRIIEARRPHPDRHDDMLGMMLLARDKETGEAISHDQLRDEILTLFVASSETTAVALTWALYLLSQNPAQESRLHGELGNVLGGRAPTRGDTASLNYTRMVFEEAMRLYPPAFCLHRWALEDDHICGRVIPARTPIIISPYVTHRNPKLWPQPERFDPERFTTERSEGRHRFAYFPFGGGPRICIGNHFAMMEGQLVLATLAQTFRFRLAPGQRVEPFGRITLRPRFGMKMYLQKH